MTREQQGKMKYLDEWSSSCFALCTVSTALLSPLSSGHCCVIPHSWSLISHCYFSLSWLLWQHRPIEGRCPKPVGTIKGVLRTPPGLSRKQPSPPFTASAIYCLLSWQRWDLMMLTLLLKWPPVGLPFTALWWNPVPPFIPTCAPQIFKLGLHKHCRAGEAIPDAVWSGPAAL